MAYLFAGFLLILAAAALGAPRLGALLFAASFAAGLLRYRWEAVLALAAVALLALAVRGFLSPAPRLAFSLLAAGAAFAAFAVLGPPEGLF